MPDKDAGPEACAQHVERPRTPPGASSARQAGRSLPVTALVCVLIAVASGAVYLLFAPDGADLPAAVYRSDLFARAGFTFVDNGWYGSHNLPAYSVLAPPLGAWIGVKLSAALAVVVACGLFALLLERTLPRRTTWPASVLFALTLSATLFTDRVAFLVGLPLGIAALLAAAHERRGLAVVLALATPLASPVAGAFLALIGASWTVASRRAFGLVLGVAGVLPIALLNLLFPEGGSFPMSVWVLIPALVALAGVAIAADRDLAAVRVGALLYAVIVVFCFAVPNAAGANVARLIALTAAPLLALELWERPRLRWVLVVALPLTLYWAAGTSLTALRQARGDPTAQAGYFDGLNAQLERIERRAGHPIRVEIPFTRLHWEAARVADHVAIARGWLRQLDRSRNALFYDDDRPLTAARYEGWLRDNGIGYVALPAADVPLDFSATQEAALIRDGLPALHEVWHDARWRLYRVQGSLPLGVTAMGPDWFDVQLRRGQQIDTRIRYSAHWAVIDGSGCVSRTSDGFTRVRASRAGTLHIGVRVDPLRAILYDGERCTG